MTLDTIKSKTNELIEFIQSNDSEFKELFSDSIRCPVVTTKNLVEYRKLLEVVTDANFNETYKKDLDNKASYNKNKKMAETNAFEDEGGINSEDMNTAKEYLTLIKKPADKELFELLYDEASLVRRMTGGNKDPFCVELRNKTDELLSPLKETMNKNFKIKQTIMTH